MLSKEDKKIKNGVSILTFIINEYKLDFQLKLLVYQGQLELSFFKIVAKHKLFLSLLYSAGHQVQDHIHLDKSIVS